MAPAYAAGVSRADPFPREPFTALLRRLPRYGRLAWQLGRDPRVPGARRAALIGGAAYLASPIDLVPGIIPVAGQLDDAAAVLIGLRIALRGLPPDERRELLDAAGLRAADLDGDLRTIGACYAWLGRQGARLGMRAARALGRAAGRAGVAVGRRLRREG
jgi:uncharacterized membrane protein YkvA (DUF1232 family)